MSEVDGKNGHFERSEAQSRHEVAVAKSGHEKY